MKLLFRILHFALLLVGVVTASYYYALTRDLHWLALGFIAAPPLLQFIAPFDRDPQIATKLRKPRVSLLVLIGLAFLLLTVPRIDLSIALGLGCLGSFLLDTYWASDR